MLLPWHSQLSHEIVLGMNDYFRDKTQWQFFHLFSNGQDLESVFGWEVDGIVAALQGEEMFALAERSPHPLVSTHGGNREAEVHQVDFDTGAIGGLAAAYLAGLGHGNFGFIGSVGENGPAIEAAFRKSLEERGQRLHVFHSEEFAKLKNFTDAFRSELAAWVRGLPRPVAILCRDDWWATPLRMVCQRLKISVPEEVSILGIGDDEVFCESLHPPLSSMKMRYRLSGFKVAQLLDKLRKRPGMKRQHILLSPERVVERQTTSLFATADSFVLAALEYIRKEAANQITVEEVAAASGVSRRVLEQRFHAVLGRGPHTEIRRQRIEKAKVLLATTDLSLERVAEGAGFASANYMGDAMRAEIGVGPRDFRRMKEEG